MNRPPICCSLDDPERRYWRKSRDQATRAEAGGREDESERLNAWKGGKEAEGAHRPRRQRLGKKGG